jgi:hypothetical protein
MLAVCLALCTHWMVTVILGGGEGVLLGSQMQKPKLSMVKHGQDHRTSKRQTWEPSACS